DDPAQPGYIETIPRVGYRLVAPVQVLGTAEAGAATPEAAADMAIASGPGAPPDGANAAAPLPAEPFPAAGARPEKIDVPAPAPRRRWRSSVAALALALALAALAAIAWQRAAQTSRPQGG